MSSHFEVFKNVDVEWNKETGILNIKNQSDEQLALLYVLEEE